MWRNSLLIGCLIVASIFAGCNTRAKKEQTLRSELYSMRYAIDQSANRNGRLPSTLQELARAGYLTEIPVDPFTGRSDTWEPQYSADPKSPGIIDVKSGSTLRSSKGDSYNSW
jgi:general secretion pathway protein G